MKAWITRSAFNELQLWNTRFLTKDFGIWTGKYARHFNITESDLPEGINPQWSDVEPIEVELKLERVKQ